MPPKNVNKNGKATPAASTKPVARAILYKEVTLNGGTTIPRDKLRVSATTMKKLLGLETESEFKERTGSKIGWEGKSPGYLNEHGEFIPVLYTDAAGERVCCSRNARNRHFSVKGMLRYRQEILKRRWRLNLETIIFSSTGNCLSGQKRGAALCDAVLEWKLHPEKYPEWGEEEPYIEALIAAGCDEDNETIQTLDNVDPRTLADAFYTSDLFASDVSERDRDELSRMLDAATDLLWQRTGVDAVPQEERVYQTISEGTDFLNRHRKLMACVKHVFEENKDRGISTLKVSAGGMAACMYLMGSSASDPSAYNGGGKTEAALDWERWDKAEEFVTLLAQSSDEGADFHPVRRAIGALVDVGPGTGRAVEKYVALAKAWAIFLDSGEMTEEAVAPEYLPPDDKGNVKLAEHPSFGGIDAGPEPDVDPEEATDAPVDPEEIRARIAEEQAARVAAARAAKAPLNRTVNQSAARVEAPDDKPDAEIGVEVMSLLGRVSTVHEGVFSEEIEGASPAAIRRVLLDLQRKKKVKMLPGERWEKVEANGKAKKKAEAK